MLIAAVASNASFYCAAPAPYTALLTSPCVPLKLPKKPAAARRTTATPCSPPLLMIAIAFACLYVCAPQKLPKKPAPARFGRKLTATQKARAPHLCIDCGYVSCVALAFGLPRTMGCALRAAAARVCIDCGYVSAAAAHCDAVLWQCAAISHAL